MAFPGIDLSIQSDRQLLETLPDAVTTIGDRKDKLLEDDSQLVHIKRELLLGVR